MVKPQLGKFSDARESWLKLDSFELVLFVGYPKGEPEGAEEYWELSHLEAGEHKPVSIQTTWLRSRRSPIYFNLTHMTEEELTLFRDFINRAVDIALPTVRALDARAQQALEDGDDAWARSYRPDPTLVIRERKADQRRSSDDGLPREPDDAGDESQHDQGLPGRREGDDPLQP